VAFLFINVNHEVGFEFSESIPISTGYILANLKAGGWDGVILDDVRDRPLTLNSLEKWIHRVEPSVIGFTAYQSTMNRIRFLCRYIKSRHRHIRVALGGPQGTLMPSSALEELEDVDMLVRGEGETVLVEMAEALDAGDPLESVGGITCRCEGRIVDTDPGPDPPENLDEYPSPYLTDVLNLEGKDTAILLSSRGCSHVCLFCTTPRICKGRVRYHSVERTVQEMESLTERGITRFWFADPNFTENRDRTERLLQAKMDRGIATPFWCQTRSDLVDSALLEKLHQAGADTVAFGLESGSPGVLKATNKRTELDRLRTNVETAHALGLKTELFSIFGLPGETVEDARQTLEFVRSLGISIESNSGSQQMQLYFGSIYERNPEKYGFKPTQRFRNSFMSIGDQYETKDMPKAELRRVRNMWSLANEQMRMDVHYKQRTFEVLDFLLQNRLDLEEEPAFHAYGAMAAVVIEEFPLLGQFLDGYATTRGANDADTEELIASISFFEESDEPAGPMDRVIFDARSWTDGVPFTAISGKYWDVFLGRGLLLPTFEEGFAGALQDRDLRFGFTFPEDYMQEELRGKVVEVEAKIRKVFKSFNVRTIEEVKGLRIHNTYQFPDLDLLRENNEILYYLALRDAQPEGLRKTPRHFLMLIHRLAKLNKFQEIQDLANLVQGKASALNALGDTLVAAGKSSWALEFYEAVATDEQSSVLKRVRSLIEMGEGEQAIDLLQSIPEGTGLEFQETMLERLKATGTNTNRIPSLEHHVLDLRVNATLERRALPGTARSERAPIVHGFTGIDDGQ